MEGKNLLQFLHEEAVLDMGMMNRRNWLRKNSRGSANSPKPLFLKKNNIKKKNLCSLKDCLKPGYAIEVTAITSKTLRKRYTYVGTIIAIRRRGKSLGQRNSFQSFFVKQKKKQIFFSAAWQVCNRRFHFATLSRESDTLYPSPYTRRLSLACVCLIRFVLALYFLSIKQQKLN